jgi:hypothetical protein
MPPRLNDDKRTLQFLFTVQRQGAFKLGMHGNLCGGRHAEINDSRPAALDKDEASEIAVAGHKDAALLVSDPNQFYILGLGQAQLSRRCDIMAQALRKRTVLA